MPDDTTTATDALPDFEDSVKQDKLVPQGPAWATLQDTELAELIATYGDQVEAAQAVVNEMKSRRSKMLALLQERMEASKARVINHPDLDIVLDIREDKERRIDVLRKLYDLANDGVLPLEKVKEGIFEYQPPPEWHTNLTKLNPLAKYGEKVAKILKAGIVPYEVSRRVIVSWKEKPQKQVTPAKEQLTDGE